MTRELDAYDAEALFGDMPSGDPVVPTYSRTASRGGLVTRPPSRSFDFHALQERRQGFGLGELSKKDPADWARAMLLENCRNGVAMIAFWRGAWWAWDSYWKETPSHLMRHRVFEFFDGKKFSNYDADTKDLKITRVKPDTSMVSQTLDVLCGLCAVDDNVEPFTWRASGPDPDFLLPVKNGILDLLTGKLLPHSPEFMATGTADWTWTGNAYPPERFSAFLRSLWPVDEGQRALLQELLGWLISGDRSLQKIAVLHGPTRAGKGTIIRLLQYLIGAQRFTPLTAAAFGSQFGFAGTVDKRVAIAGDLRVDRSVDAGAMTERLLQISGGDTLQVSRKYLSDWTGTPTARILISANELPRLPDDSGALANRYVPLSFTRVFLGKEDTMLDADLREEAEGITKWAMTGLQRLLARGRFELPESSLALTRRSLNAASPVRQFVGDRCKLDAKARTPVDTIYAAYTDWCLEESITKPMAKNRFGEALQNAFADISVGRMQGGRGEKRASAYIGIRLKRSGFSPDTIP